MKKLAFLIALFALTISCTEKNKTFTASEIAILPKPDTLLLAEASFAFEEGQKIVATSASQQNAADDLIRFVNAKTELKILKAESSGAITFEPSEGLDHEAYELIVTPKNITIKASGQAGYFYGVQTLKQLLSKDVSKTTNTTKYLVPSVTIKDSPRFKWRAYMLDESRYFQGEAFVKKILNQMTLLKMNTFHWHLVDDAGWRIEIKKYSLLTEVGAFRKDSEIGT